MTYTLGIRRSAQKALARIARPDRDRIILKIEALKDNPRPEGCKKLSGRDGWRIRVGDYLVLYDIQDDRLVVSVIAIGHRGGVYR